MNDQDRYQPTSESRNHRRRDAAGMLRFNSEILGGDQFYLSQQSPLIQSHHMIQRLNYNINNQRLTHKTQIIHTLYNGSGAH